jgi:glycosyltransferase involved in cell wall biosynthesis
MRGDTMRIAQVAPLIESVPPKYYGGTERVVSYLTEELVGRGHEVTLFASGDSTTKARLVAGCRRALRLDRHCVDPMAHHVLMLEHVAQRARDFEVIHYHLDYLHYSLSRRHDVPQLTTLHGRLDIPDLEPLYREFSDMPVVSISMSQRNPLPGARWIGNVYHGLPIEQFHYSETPGAYMAFLGRISPEERVDRAIEIARQVGLPLKIAAKVDKVDRDYFETCIRPQIRGPQVEYLGEIGNDEKDEFLGHACVLLFPIAWEEPFGLAMIESLACGTPVIAFRRGSVAEVIEDGRSGFIVEDLAGAVQAIAKVPTLSRRECRMVFEERFTAVRMADEYLRLYYLLADRHPMADAG